MCPSREESKEDTSSLANLWFLSFREERTLGRGLRKPAKGLEECSEKEQRSFSCLYYLKCDFAESGSPYKNVAGLLSPRPRFLSSRKERNQRFAKEEVSSLETPLRGKTAPLLPAFSCFSVCGPENGQSPFSELFCRKVTSLGNFAKRSSLPLSAPAAGGCQVLHLSLRTVECFCRIY